MFVGDKLSSADNQRERGLESKELIEMFQDLNGLKAYTEPKLLLQFFLEWTFSMGKYKIPRNNIKSSSNVKLFSDKKVESLYEVVDTCAD